MGIADLFRPKHRHSNADVRAEAVRQLSPDEADLVVSIARGDRATSVRRIAIGKIDDPDALVDLADEESERSLRELARSRAAGIWVTRAVTTDNPEDGQVAIDGLARLGDQKAIADVASRAELIEIRDAALAELDESKALAELARNSSTHMSARQTAIRRIGDQEVLRSIAVDEKRKDIALLALDRIDDPEAWEVVATKAKNKVVRARARKKVSEQQKTEGASPEEKRRHAERVQLVRRAQSLARGSEFIDSVTEMARIRRDWEALGSGADDDLVARFERASKRYDKRAKAYEGARQAKRAAAETEAEAAGPETVEAEAAEGETVEAEAVEAVATTAEGQPAEESAESESSEEDRLGAEQAEEEEAERRRERAEKQKERQERDLATLAELIAELDAAHEDGKRKVAERALQKADKTFPTLKIADGEKEEVTRFKAARKKLWTKVQELREVDDWQRWANVPRQEALIEKAKALLGDEDSKKLSERLRSLQTEWKGVGPVPHKKSQELWTEFKSLCDQIYERVKVQRARASEEHAANLALKVALCEKVEVLAESTDWDQTADEIKALQREWKAIGPVPRKKSDAIWKRFRGACDRFFERRKPHLEELLAEREANLKVKLAMCEKAEELAASEDWQETSVELRELQREWRNAGPVPRKDAAEVNKRFRGACDHFFERRQKHRDEEKAARARQLDELRAKIESLMGSSQSPPGESGDAGSAAEPADAVDPVAQTLEVRSTLRELGLQGDEKQSLYELANTLYRKMLDTHPRGFEGTELDPDSSRQKKAKRVAKVEQIAPPPRESADDSSAQTPEQMAEKLRAALAENALSASLATSTDGRNTADTIAELRSDWLVVGPVPGPEGEALEKRFQSACERALRAAGVGDK